tara:strand:+ start:575 stop:700 length:126 start_codon:yes stop_codon:yes gene_type:complete
VRLVEVNYKWIVYDVDNKVIIITRNKNIAIRYARKNGTYGD